MTIYWNPIEDDVDPETIDIWHVNDDGTTNGPITADVSDVDGMPDSAGGIAPDAVRERVGGFIESNSPADDLWQQVVIDMLTLDYERGEPPD